jgi:hypothetical protein
LQDKLNDVIVRFTAIADMFLFVSIKDALEMTPVGLNRIMLELCGELSAIGSEYRLLTDRP